jgi:hypothetical protein
MLVYRADERVVDTLPMLERLIRTCDRLERPTHDAVTELFIDVAEFEAGVADRLSPNRDGLSPLITHLRRVSLRSAHALIASWRNEPARRDRELASLRVSLRDIQRGELPTTIALRVSEGYAYYGLHPESYAMAAEAFADACHPRWAVCIGIRSIGTGLSAVVGAALECTGVPVTLYSVRPRGHPFDRVVSLDSDLERAWRTAPPGAYFLVVDEGPGLSGSSFAAVVRVIEGLGIPADRVILFPSWNPDGASFRSESARTVWRNHRRFCRSADDLTPALAPRREGIDLSAGSWREAFCGEPHSWPAAQPQHERSKRWLPDSGTIVRFAGLGRYGRARQERAEVLAGAGLGAPPRQLTHGYLALEFIPGRVCSQADPDLIDAIATHVAVLTTRFPATRSPDVGTLIDMAATNARLGLGDDAPQFELDRYRAALDAAPCAAIDGRMLPHEWLDTGSGFVKVDALDHHDDHFFPGIQDAGWDLAAAAFEFDLDAAGRDRMVAGYAAATGDRDVVVRLPFYEIAYPAFRLGYATLASAALGGSADARRFEAVASRCRARLQGVLMSPNAP